MAEREFHYRWEWDCKSSRDKIWRLLADTNRYNRDVGLPSVEEDVKVSSALANMRRRLQARFLGVLEMDWEEEPFEWVRPERYGITRRYAKGPMTELRVLVNFEPIPNGGTHLVYETWAKPRGLIGLFGIPFQLGFLQPRIIDRVVRRYDALPMEQIVADSRNHLAPGGHARLATLSQSLIQQGGAAPEQVQRLAHIIEHDDDITLARLRPYALADEWGAPRREVLELCLRATRVGMLNLEWDLLCPMCRGTKSSADTLGDLAMHGHCEICHVDFEANFERLVEITFRPNPTIRRVEERFFCTGGPEVTPHIVAQQILAPHTDRRLALPLEAGRYRMRTPLIPGGQFLSAESGGAANLELPLNADGWQNEELRMGLAPTLHFDNRTDEEQLVIFERTAWTDQAVTAADVTTLQMFRDLFSSEALRPGEQIAVGSLTIVFTDLRDSTSLYRHIGDAPAFGRVMTHFDILRDAIAAEEGAIVKTIGDGVMAVFRRPVAAVRAMARAEKLLASPPDGSAPLILKVGIHHSPCIAVTLNERLDYFGTSVNIAARIQSLASGNDIVISESVHDDLEVSEWLTDPRQQLRMEGFEARVKGIEGTLKVWRVQRAEAGAPA
ncbi:MAG: DUF5939 domain-containing protein [Anaerolineae bacterium]